MSGKDKKVIVGMSGGVDSSVAAALLKKQGFRVTGVIMKIWAGGITAGKGKHGCYGPEEEEDIEDARRVAAKLDIPLHVIDLTREYKDEVLDYFCHEYLEGRTPNPCIRCNRRIKFGAMITKASKLGIAFDYFATGHYVRTEKDPASGRWLLKKGSDLKKDQSYFLYGLSQEQLSCALFPLGGYLKQEVRRLSVELQLGVENKEESQNFVCGSYTSLFEKQPEPGPVMDKQGNILGRHKGIVHYTLGQRKGLAVASTKPLFVTDIKPELNAVIVGPREDLYTGRQSAKELNWIAIARLKDKAEVKARIRSSHTGYDAVIWPLGGDKVHVAYREPQIGAARGQAIVFYDGDVVMGGGIAE
ncbi:MAG: tRNA 2-thiouridine(34) synthase MnmA [Dehalococcoidia bacterium]|jgi:tRNA-specific 2-thiouridylase